MHLITVKKYKVNFTACEYAKTSLNYILSAVPGIKIEKSVNKLTRFLNLSRIRIINYAEYSKFHSVNWKSFFF